jgi:hypothetical protein
MGNLVRHYPGYGCGHVQGSAPFGPPKLRWQRPGGGVCMLRVHD